jgi:hypothetical protein
MVQHERRLSAKSGTQRPVPEKNKALGSVGNEHEGDEHDAAQVVAEHGPAHEIHITHSEGSHSVESHHGDGHVHRSEHASASEAHDHARDLSSDDDGNGMEDGGGEPAMSIPGLDAE